MRNHIFEELDIILHSLVVSKTPPIQSCGGRFEQWLKFLVDMIPLINSSGRM